MGALGYSNGISNLDAIEAGTREVVFPGIGLIDGAERMDSGTIWTLAAR